MRKATKKIFVITLGLTLSLGVMSFSNLSNSEPISVQSSSFKLVNDTGASVKLKHKGGSMTLQKGGSTSMSCTRTGNDIYIDGDKVHTVSSDDCGKTIKLSTWM